MKRYLPLLILALIFTGAAIANAQMWRLGNMVELCGGVPCEDLLGGTISKRPTEYKTNIAEQKTEGHSGTTLKVSSITTKDGNTLDPSVLGSLIVLSINPSASNAETVVCTGLTTSTKTFTGCTFGYRFDNPTATSSANIKAHSPGEPVIISNTDTYEAQKFVTIDGDTTITASNTVSGLWQWSHSKGTCFAGTSLCIRGNGGRLEWSEDGFANSFNFTTSTGVVLTASTTQGIQIISSQIGINVSTTNGGLSFDSDGRLKILYGANSGVGTNGNGLFVERGDTFAWTGTHTFSGAGFSITASTNTIPKTGTNTSTLNGSFFGTTTPGAVFYIGSDGYIKALTASGGQHLVITASGTAAELVNPYAAGTGEQAAGATGDQIITHNLGGVPTLIEITAVTETDGAGAEEAYATSYGITTTTNGGQASWAAQSLQSLADLEQGRTTTNTIFLVDNTTAIAARATITAISTTTFTINWAVNTSGNTNSTRYFTWKAFR